MHYLRRVVDCSRHFANIAARAVRTCQQVSTNQHIAGLPLLFRRYSIMSSPAKVCIVGSGNWGSAIARIVGNNVLGNSKFEKRVDMWVFEETVNGKKLTEIINTEHENVKYLPGFKLPDNVVAVPDVKTAAAGADILVFVVPHQFVGGICEQLKDVIKPTSIAVSLIKGLNIKDKGLQLISQLISSTLKIDCNVLMGANLAPEVAAGNFCETTIGVVKEEYGPRLKELFETETFRCVVVGDATTVELCGALKNVVAVGAGIVDGLGYGDNTKAAVIRLGLMEMVVFAQTFYEGVKTDTFLESCGVGDLVTTCYGGRNRRVAEAFVKTGKPIKQLEIEMLNGQSLQGPHTAREVNFMLKNKDMEDKFPLFTSIYHICNSDLPPQEMIRCLHDHPEHL